MQTSKSSLLRIIDVTFKETCMSLHEYMERKGLSLRAFAKIAGVSVATVLRARDGSVMSSRRTLKAIVDATGGEVGISDLIRIEETQGEKSILEEKTKGGPSE